MQYYDWDEWKSRVNERKHGMRLADAAPIFRDPYVMIEFDCIVDGEERWQAIGSSLGEKLLFVAHTIETQGLDEVVRLISARQVTRSERRRYEQNRKKNDG
jgi:uncharacterized DUF497 family protein